VLLILTAIDVRLIPIENEKQTPKPIVTRDKCFAIIIASLLKRFKN
jgi:hypothetical protein